jgi:hypothetical protein
MVLISGAPRLRLEKKSAPHPDINTMIRYMAIRKCKFSAVNIRFAVPQRSRPDEGIS